MATNTKKQNNKLGKYLMTDTCKFENINTNQVQGKGRMVPDLKKM